MKHHLDKKHALAIATAVMIGSMATVVTADTLIFDGAAVKAVKSVFVKPKLPQNEHVIDGVSHGAAPTRN